MAKVKIGDLIKGAGTGWLQPNADEQATIRRQQLADMRMGGTQMPTRTRGGGVRQPGISESELNDIKQQPAGEVLKPRDLYSGSDVAKQRAEVLGARRAGGNLPEQRTPIDRHARAGVDESKVTDPKRVQEFADMIQKDGGGKVGGVGNTTGGTGAVAPVSGYDDILKMVRHDALAEGDMARRQHNREVMTGLGDLVSSIANLWSTTKGGPNGYDNSKGMTATVQARYANDLARRRAQQEQILNYYRVKKAAEDDAETRKYRRQLLEIRANDAARRQAESDAKIKREDDIAAAKQNLLDSQSRKNEADTIKKRGENQYAVTYWEKYAEYRATMSHEEADRRANIDAAAAEQEVLNAKEQREEKKNESVVAKNNRSNAKSGGRSGGRGSSNKGYTEDVEYKYDADGNKVGYTKTRKPAGAGYTKPKRQNTNRGYTKPGKK